MRVLPLLFLGVLAGAGCQQSVPGVPTTLPTPRATQSTAGQPSAVGEDEPWCLPGNAADWEAFQASQEESKTRVDQGPPPDLGELVEKLHSPSPDDRLNAIRTLGNLGPAAAPAVPELQEALNARHPTVQRGYELVGFQFQGPVLWAFSRIGPAAEPAVDDILRIAVSSDPDFSHADYEFQVLSIQALGSIGPGALRAVEPLLKLAESIRPGDVRLYYTLKSIGQIGGEKAWEGLEKYLRSEDRTARALAARTLIKVRPDLVEPVFENFVQDDPEVAVELVSYLKFTKKRMDFLLTSLHSDYPEKAVEGLARMGPRAKEAVPRLVKLERKIDREPLVSALRSMDPTGVIGVPLIHPGLNNEGELWRTLDLLDRLDTREARKVVKAYLDDHPEAEKQLQHMRDLRTVSDVGM